MSVFSIAMPIFLVMSIANIVSHAISFVSKILLSGLGFRNLEFVVLLV